LDSGTEYRDRRSICHAGSQPGTRPGGLISYGLDQVDQFRQSAAYADRIPKGAKVAELPVQYPTKFEFVVNLKTAKVLGLAIPDSFLQRADEVIE
jgi:putative ABC transport system substrate-binding protein